MILVARINFLLAIDRAAGRSEDHPLQPAFTRRFHQIKKAHQVNLRIECRIRDRTPYVHLSREMHDYFGPLVVDSFGNCLSIA